MLEVAKQSIRGETGVVKVAKVKDIIHLYEREDWSKRKIAKHFGISRGTVDRVVANPDRYLPKSEPVDRTSSKMTTQIMAFIDGIIESDKKINREQRHTSRRIWERVIEEFGEDSSPAESTVRRYVGKVKKRNPEPFIPLGFVAGQSMQGDFGEVTVKIDGEKCRVYFWAQRLSYSRATCVSVYPRATQECFLDGQQRALQFFDGVPVMHIIDNLKAAIKSGLGRNAVETERFDAFQTHYGFRTEACNGASGNEKGQVESLVGFIQRNWFSGLPEFNTWEELIAYVDAQNVRYLKRHHPEERGRTVGELLEEERRVLRALPPPFRCCKEGPVTASKTSLVIYVDTLHFDPTKMA
jgi:transposase